MRKDDRDNHMETYINYTIDASTEYHGRPLSGHFHVILSLTLICVWSFVLPLDK